MGKLNCLYLKKSEFDHASVFKSLSNRDIKKICKDIGLNPQTGMTYKLTNGKYADIKVPIDFIDKAIEKSKENIGKVKQIEESLKDLSE